MTSIEDQIAQALDDNGVPRGGPTLEATGEVAAAAKLETKRLAARLKSAERERDQALDRAERKAEKLARLDKDFTAYRHAVLTREQKAAAERRRAEAADQVKKQAWSAERVTVKHPERDLFVRLTDGLIMVALDEAFFITSQPLKASPHGQLAMHEVCSEFLATLDEWPWIEEQLGTLARFWRLEEKCPLAADYVETPATRRALEAVGVVSLKDAEGLLEKGAKGIGAARRKEIREAVKRYGGDCRRTGVEKTRGRKS